VSESSYADVWRRLEHEWGVVLPPDVRAANTPRPTATLIRCDSCGLDRFEPMAPGDGGFYAQLAASMPYAEDRWDFEIARSLVRPTDDVVDLGCGDGRFLASLGLRVGRTAGVDTNAPAVERLRERGGEAYATDFDAFAREHAGEFDVVTSFHTMEHVPDPVAMGRAAARCLRSGGRFLLSLPNRDHVWRDERAPLDRPPHHVTRWSPEQVTRLAFVLGLMLHELRFEEADLRPRSVARRVLDGDGIRGRLQGLRPAILAASVRTALRSGARGSARETPSRLPGHTMLAELRLRDR
jgi:SAM-dependent methyltransferase